FSADDVLFGKVGPQGGDDFRISERWNRSGPANQPIITITDDVDNVSVFVATVVRGLVQDNDPVIPVLKFEAKRESGSEPRNIGVLVGDHFWKRRRGFSPRRRYLGTPRTTRYLVTT